MCTCACTSMFVCSEYVEILMDLFWAKRVPVKRNCISVSTDIQGLLKALSPEKKDLFIKSKLTLFTNWMQTPFSCSSIFLSAFCVAV